MFIKLFGIIAGIALSACAYAPLSESHPDPRSLGSNLKPYRAIDNESQAAVEITELRGSITLRESLTLALKGSVLNSPYPTQGQVKEVL